MDYIQAPRHAPPDVHAQMEKILHLLHSEGYVFGDLRKPNILFDEQGKAKLIDFNWCGQYDMNIVVNVHSAWYVGPWYGASRTDSAST